MVMVMVRMEAGVPHLRTFGSKAGDALHDCWSSSYEDILAESIKVLWLALAAVFLSSPEQNRRVMILRLTPVKPDEPHVPNTSPSANPLRHHANVSLIAQADAPSQSSLTGPHLSIAVSRSSTSSHTNSAQPC